LGEPTTPAFRHRGLQVVSGEPSSGFRHVGDILKDEDIVRVFGASEYSAIRDACRIAGLLMVIVTLAPCSVVLNFVVDRQVFGLVLCIHRHSPESNKVIISNVFHSIYNLQR